MIHNILNQQTTPKNCDRGYIMATKKFHCPDTPTTVTTVASIEERFDRKMNIYNSTPIIMNDLENIFDSTTKSTASYNIIEEASTTSSSSARNNNENNVENGIVFAKSQALLNQSYKNRRLALKKLPLACRKITGINLKNLHPLAVRNGEFC